MYHITGQYKKEKKLYSEAEEVFDDPNSVAFGCVVQDQAILAISVRDSIAAKRYIDKYVSVMKENSSSEADIEEGLGWTYWKADKKVKAIEYFRKGLLSEPENPQRMNTLANRLIEI